MLQSIVKWINEQLCQLNKDGKLYLIAKSAVKDDKTMPYVEGSYIGIDDTYPIQIYHKQLGMSTITIGNSGYGDSVGDLQTTHQMALIVFFNEVKCRLKPEDLYEQVLAKLTGILKLEGYKYVRINVQNAILDDQRVYAQEYGQTNYRLGEFQRLIQINYQVLFVFDKNCISNCKTN